ncbi:hypothetical protein HK405_004200, partial [Cladochytrium tenue]
MPPARRRLVRLTAAVAAAAALGISAGIGGSIAPAAALSLYEPPDGTAILGAWVDTADPTTSASGGDTPSKFNSRVGFNAGAFELAQDLPLAVSNFTGEQLTANLSMVQATGTNAIFFVTVYPNAGWSGYNSTDLNNLVTQLVALTSPSGSARRVMVRFAPEMNGYFNLYGQQPTKFKAAWQALVNATRAATDRVAFVWSPNEGVGYPYGTSADFLSTAETTVLDTNGDGTVDFADDPYSPYWPGADYVDWVGLSVYWKGYAADAYAKNADPPANYFEQVLVGGPYGSNASYNFYKTYSEGYSKPFAMSEGGAAFATSVTTSGVTTAVPAGDGDVAVKQTFWRSATTNTTFLDTYPKVKLFLFFEFIKPLEDAGVTRDYRVSNASDVLAAFQADVDSVADRYYFAGAFAPGTDPLSIGFGSGSSGSSSTGSSSSTSSTTRTGAAASAALPRAWWTAAAATGVLAVVALL